MPEEKSFIRRFPYIEIPLSRISYEKGRIAVVGVVVSKDEQSYTFIVNDGNVQMVVITNNTDEFNKIVTGKLVRVLGRPIGEGEETEILADIVQDFSGLDKELYDQII